MIQYITGFIDKEEGYYKLDNDYTYDTKQEALDEWYKDYDDDSNVLFEVKPIKRIKINKGYTEEDYTI